MPGGSLHNQLGDSALLKSRISSSLARGMEKLRLLTETRGKTFVFRHEGNPRVAMSATDFELIMTNLLHNAIKYGHSGTTIKIAYATRWPNLTVDVTSYGIPIPPVEQERIFDPGYRTSEACGIEFTAAGLGLCVARRAAERYGGHLFVRASEPVESWGSQATYRSTFRLIVRCEGEQP